MRKILAQVYELFFTPGKSKQAICFLQSLHPLVKRKPISQRDVKPNHRRKSGAKMILVKQFGVTYKYCMNEDDLPSSAKVEFMR